MTASRSAVSFRTMIRDTTLGGGESLQNVNTAELPDGATCFVLSTRTVYRLNKASSEAASASAIIAPASGPGRWFLTSTDSPEAFVDPVYVVNNGNNNYPTTVFGDWVAPSTSAFGIASPLVFSSWSIGTLGVLTYNGPSGLFWRIQSDITIDGTVAAAAHELLLVGISRNGDLSGSILGAPGTAQGAGVTTRGNDIVARTTVVRATVLNAGDVLQLRIANLAPVAPQAVLSEYFTMTAQLLN